MATVKKLTITAPSEADALARARAKYDPAEYEFRIETIEEPKKGLFGIGAKPGKFVVTARKIETEEELDLDDLVGDLRSISAFADDSAKADEPSADRDEDAAFDDLSRRADKLLSSLASEQPARPKKEQPKQNPPKQSQQNPQNPPKAAERKPQPPKPEQPKPEAPKAEQPRKSEPPKAEQPRKPEAPKAEQPRKPEAPKTEQPRKPEPPKKVELPREEMPAVGAVSEMREHPKTSELPAGDELPAALRTPVRRTDAPKKKQKQKIVRPEDSRSETEKKSDLLSAVMGIEAPERGSTENYVVPAQPRPEHAAEDDGEPITVTLPVKAKRDRGPRAPREPRENKPRRERGPKPAARTELPAEDGSADAAETAEPVSTGRIEFAKPEEIENALAFINTLLENMGLTCRAAAVAAPEGTEVPEGMAYAKIDVAGPDTSVLIGHHGDTLDAIQYLVNLAGGKSASSRKEYVKIVVDVENYRAKREETLRTLARRMAAKAVRTRRNVVLEPMNPYERRIIHSELHDVENVSTHSVGSDENRKVVVTYEGADARRKPERTGAERSDRNRRGSRKPKTVVLPPDDGDVADAETIARVIAERAERRNDDGRRSRAKSLDEIDLGIVIPPLTTGEPSGEIPADADEAVVEPVADVPAPAETEAPKSEESHPQSSVLDVGVEHDAPNLPEDDSELLHEF